MHLEKALKVLLNYSQSLLINFLVEKYYFK